MDMSNQSTLSDLTGSLCEVLTLDNRILFAGVFEKEERTTTRFRVDLYHGDSTPQGILHQTEVKLRIFSPKHPDQVALLYALVLGCAQDYWILEFQNILFCDERRQNFRYSISANGSVRRMTAPDMAAQYPCKLVDISATGTLFYCSELFSHGEVLELSLPSLRPGGPAYQLSCTVRRVLDSPRHSSGCEFVSLSPHLEQQLYQDLFALQAQSISRRPKR